MGQSPTPFIWELVVLDALQAMATVEYESSTESGKTPDFWIPRLVSQPLRAEAAYVEDRFFENEKRRRALIARLAKELQSRGMPAGSIGWEILGEQTPAGPKQILPKEHELKRFFASPPLQNFLRSLVARPELASACDLLPHGYTLRLFYIPKGSTRPLVSGHSLVADAPTAVEEHIVFRTLVAKGRKAKKAQLNEPYLVFIGSEGSPSMTEGRSARVITRERAPLKPSESTLSCQRRSSFRSNTCIRTSHHGLRDRFFSLTRSRIAPLLRKILRLSLPWISIAGTTGRVGTSGRGRLRAPQDASALEEA